MLIPLGKITVAAHGTPVLATTNLTNPTARLGIQSVTVQAWPANAGIVYVGYANMVRASGVGVLASLAKPSNGTTGPFDRVTFTMQSGANGINANDLFIDADTDADGALVTVTAG